MNVRFTDEEAAVLRVQAQTEERSMGDVVRAAVREYVERHGHHARVADALAVLGPRNAALLDRLGKA